MGKEQWGEACGEMPWNKDIKIGMRAFRYANMQFISLFSSPQIDKIMSSIGAGIGTELEGNTEDHSGLCVSVCVVLMHIVSHPTTFNIYP